MTGNLATLLGLLVPLIVAVVVNCKTSSAVKGTIAAIFCVLVGVLISFSGSIPNLETVAGNIITVIVLAQSIYSMFWKPLGISSWVIEHIGSTVPKAAE